MEIKRIKIQGCGVSLIKLEEAAEHITNEIKSNRGVRTVTINPEMCELAKTDERFARFLNEAELVVADGSGIRLGLMLKGIKQEPVPGIELAERVLQKCEENNIPAAFFGAKEEVLNAACENMLKKYPKLNIAFKRNGYFAENEEEQIINDIKNSQARFILVALGAPKQEFFIQKCFALMPERSFIGVGGSFDVWSGNTVRAPQIFRKFGCEWLYRTIKQPSRIKRIYKVLPMFLIKVIMEAAVEKLKGN